MTRQNRRNPNRYPAYDDWDHVERRSGGNRRVYNDPYYLTPQIPPNPKPWYNGPALTVIFSILMTVAGFVLTLNNRVSTLEFQTQEFKTFESEVKEQFIEIKVLAKEHQEAHEKLKSQLNAIELSVSEAYRLHKSR